MRRVVLSMIVLAGCGRLGYGGLEDGPRGEDAAPSEAGVDAALDGFVREPDAFVATDAPSLDGGLDPPCIRQISATGRVTCALDAAGDVWCWGYNGSRQFTDGTTMNHPTPYRTSFGPAIAVDAGSVIVCVLRADATMWCAGANEAGQLGDGTTTGRTDPTQVRLLEVAEIAAGPHLACARKSSGDVFCWGENDTGQLGEGTTTNRPLPTQLPTAGPASTLRSYDHSCALRDTGELVCWGRNTGGETGRTPPGPTTPMTVSFAEPITDLAVGGVQVTAPQSGHTCLVANGRVWCFGPNRYGQLGMVVPQMSETPLLVLGVDQVTSVTVGGWHTCALRATGEVWCWGRNATGQLGDGTRTDRPTPAAVMGLTDAYAISAGIYHTCAIRRTGDVVCWGENADGQLGDGMMRLSTTPVRALLDCP